MMGRDSISNDSDSIRGIASPASKHVQMAMFTEPLKLALGGVLPEVCVAYETFGTLNEARDNAILICHALSGDSHVARHDDADEPGWWDFMVGSGKAIDTDRYFVICPNCLAGCSGTTGPGSIDPLTGKPYGKDFPSVTIGDMVDLQYRLMKHLSIDKLHAVIGGSMGGLQVLWWATRYPACLEGAGVVASSPRLSSQALAFDIVGRNAILSDPNFANGLYYDKQAKPNAGLAIARMIGHITYLSRKSMSKKFGSTRNKPIDIEGEFEKKFSVGSYLGYQGQKFVERFDANSYLAITLALDMFDLGSTAAEMTQTLANSTCKWMVISFGSDWLFSPAESREIVDTLIALSKPVTYCNIDSDDGHDAFILPKTDGSFEKLTERFLTNLGDDSKLPEADQLSQDHRPTSIFHTDRLDNNHILQLVDSDMSVLDLGCENGSLLAELKRRGHDTLMGVEISERSVINCAAMGLDVLHADLNDGLGVFLDNQYDMVVLSRTLQAVRDVDGLLNDMLRIGKKCVVSFPNFAYYKLRDMLNNEGKSPESAGLLKYRWYDTPNIRFFSILDFEQYCQEKQITIHRVVGLDLESGKEINTQLNLKADLAIFVLSR